MRPTARVAAWSLAHVAVLSDDRSPTCSAAREPVDPAELATPTSGSALEAVAVAPLPRPRWSRRRRARRRRRLWTRGASAAVVLVLAARSAVTPGRRPLSTRRDVRGPGREPAAGGLVRRRRRSTWTRSTVERAPVTTSSTVPGGVVYADDRGGRALRRRRRGVTDRPDGPGASPGRRAGQRLGGLGRPGRAAMPELVVYDTRVGDGWSADGRSWRPAPAAVSRSESGPIAIDGERVYYRAPTAATSPGSRCPARPSRSSGDLVDVAGGARMVQRRRRLPVAGAALRHRRPTSTRHATARLTPDGRYAFVVEARRSLVYDVATGQPRRADVLAERPRRRRGPTRRRLLLRGAPPAPGQDRTRTCCRCRPGQLPDLRAACPAAPTSASAGRVPEDAARRRRSLAR